MQKQKKEIWIVDDAVFMRSMLKNIVSDYFDEKIVEFSNGREVVENYEKLEDPTKVELIFMDITMPEMDGIKALEKIKSINEEQKIFMCSQMANQKIIVDCIKKGANDFVIKPFNEKQVYKTLDNTFLTITYDNNGKVENMDPMIFFRLVKREKIKEINDYISSGFDLNTVHKEKDIADIMMQKESEKLFDCIMEHEHLLNEQIKRKIKAVRLNRIVGTKWN